VQICVQQLKSKIPLIKYGFDINLLLSAVRQFLQESSPIFACPASPDFGLGCLGRRAHLFPDRVRKPVLRDAAMGTGVSHQTSAGARLSGPRTLRISVTRNRFIM
jgi:hypothetical protein